jgi:hypothetical protein
LEDGPLSYGAYVFQKEEASKKSISP